MLDPDCDVSGPLITLETSPVSMRPVCVLPLAPNQPRSYIPASSRDHRACSLGRDFAESKEQDL